MPIERACIQHLGKRHDGEGSDQPHVDENTNGKGDRGDVRAKHGDDCTWQVSVTRPKIQATNVHGRGHQQNAAG